MHKLIVQNLDLPDADISYIPNFLDPAQAGDIFRELRDSVSWRQDPITVFGKTYPQPRLTALYGNNGKPYAYSNITMHPEPFTPEIRILKEGIEALCAVSFTTCLLNLYRDGRDSNGWHADNEKELGRNPVIASISLGQERFFHLKHRNRTELRHKLLLENGSLLLMQGPTQHHWLHQIPKTARTIGERINLTFRVIK
ncbi:alpha-ketoglutarate-dependent dioxygenase AlkB family protein [Poritiphilus flavus]|uniref:Alpha-ketoglutarate-dependent dioxygenase AlkB n=1 Tax=Poritiphilus flavus TaxID=2697053 RepID=A0A6L9EAN5_9FLAO|nr:alpha-ketoglutarate-dependent dioxygenase AlkB [Poritiphilus flavus]NAS11837.1 alpha-ketoglutarate-dependent dioxygenase AlkB [Poritiphilus flavus]